MYVTVFLFSRCIYCSVTNANVIWPEKFHGKQQNSPTIPYSPERENPGTAASGNNKSILNIWPIIKKVRMPAGQHWTISE